MYYINGKITWKRNMLNYVVYTISKEDRRHFVGDYVHYNSASLACLNFNDLNGERFNWIYKVCKREEVKELNIQDIPWDIVL